MTISYARLDCTREHKRNWFGRVKKLLAQKLFAVSQTSCAKFYQKSFNRAKMERQCEWVSDFMRVGAVDAFGIEFHLLPLHGRTYWHLWFEPSQTESNQINLEAALMPAHISSLTRSHLPALFHIFALLSSLFHSANLVIPYPKWKNLVFLFLLIHWSYLYKVSFSITFSRLLSFSLSISLGIGFQTGLQFYHCFHAALHTNTENKLVARVLYSYSCHLLYTHIKKPRLPARPSATLIDCLLALFHTNTLSSHAPIYLHLLARNCLLFFDWPKIAWFFLKLAYTLHRS